MFQFIDQLLSDLELSVCDAVEIPMRPESHSDTPRSIADGPASGLLKERTPGGRIWTHQAEALEKLCRGENVVISTGTASGKSLIFQIYALHCLLTDPESRVLVFYPLRALINDQLVGWQDLARAAHLEADSVRLIYGGVSMSEREAILERSRIVLMTPDVCQAWLMRTMSNPTVNKFIESLALLVLDEAHVYESVLGSNAALLLRRLLAVKRRITPRGRNIRPLQVIAATATINDPAGHLKDLTGAEFGVVDETSNGAPSSTRRILHIEGPALGADGEGAILNILESISSMKERHRFIAFVDSRQGVERIVRTLNNPDVKPYRSGYHRDDRVAIEGALRNGTLHGVVSTSALELGIDIPDMDIGLTLGLPQSRKSFRQRLGRIGRRDPGVFLLVAPRNAFSKFGEGLVDYYASSVEPSYLYAGNRFVQFAHARCLADEADALGRAPKDMLGGVNWPGGFADILTVAREGYPREFDGMAQIGANVPHLNYPLRQIGEASVKIRTGFGNTGFESELGDIAYHQAIREAYPGATYLHIGRAFRVNAWRQGFREIEISVTESHHAPPTRPILRKSVTIDLSRDGIIQGRLKKGSSGILAEAHLQINESVEGYTIGGNQFRYREERAKNPNMQRKQRDFRTTGIILKIEDEWFNSPTVRQEVADGLRELLARERSIAPQDIDSAHTNIAILEANGPRRSISDVAVIYDSVYGSLRLTENLFDEFGRFIERLRRGAELSEGDGIVSAETAEHLEVWYQSLSDGGQVPELPSTEIPEGWQLVYASGSVVGIYSGGILHERELLEARYIDDPFNPGNRVLYYSYRDDRNRNGISSTPADAVVPTGYDWDWTLWNPETGEYKDLELPE